MPASFAALVLRFEIARCLFGAKHTLSVGARNELLQLEPSDPASVMVWYGDQLRQQAFPDRPQLPVCDVTYLTVSDNVGGILLEVSVSGADNEPMIFAKHSRRLTSPLDVALLWVWAATAEFNDSDYMQQWDAVPSKATQQQAACLLMAVNATYLLPNEFSLADMLAAVVGRFSRDLDGFAPDSSDAAGRLAVLTEFAHRLSSPDLHPLDRWRTLYPAFQ